MAIEQGPTPDWDRVTLKWAGVNLDGSPVTGRLELIYNRDAPMLDEDPSLPTAIYSVALTQPLSTAIIQVRNALGVLVDRTVGYASFTVPATDDPDILGSGGTYTLIEKLDNGRGVSRTFVASKDAPNGEIWLNRITSVTPVPGQVISAVSVADFSALKSRVDALAGATVSDESVQDIVGAMFRAGAGTTIAYDDTAGTITIAAPATLDAEAVRDTIGAAIIGTGYIQVAVNDASDLIVIQGSQLLADALASKAPLVNPTFSGTVSGVTKIHVGLGSVDNTSDADKPVSTLQQAALNAKVGSVNGKTGPSIALTPADLGLPSILTRTAAQGVPSAAECAALGLPDGCLITVDPA